MSARFLWNAHRRSFELRISGTDCARTSLFAVVRGMMMMIVYTLRFLPSADNIALINDQRVCNSRRRNDSSRPHNRNKFIAVPTGFGLSLPEILSPSSWLLFTHNTIYFLACHGLTYYARCRSKNKHGSSVNKHGSSGREPVLHASLSHFATRRPEGSFARHLFVCLDNPGHPNPNPDRVQLQ